MSRADSRDEGDRTRPRSSPGGIGIYLGAFWKTYVMSKSFRTRGFLAGALEGAPDFVKPKAVDIPECDARDWSAACAFIESGRNLGDRTARSVAAVRHLADASPVDALTLAYHWPLCCEMLAVHAAPAWREAHMHDVSAGRARIAFALTEPETGSDLQALAATATPAGDGWLLDGRKEFVLGGAGADFLVCAAKTGEAVSLFIVPTTDHGVHVERAAYAAEGSAGVAGALARVTLIGVRVERDCLIGKPGEIHEPLQAAMDRLRVAVAALANCLVERVSHRALAFVHVRKQFGKPLLEADLVREKVAANAERIFALDSALRYVVGLYASRVDRDESACPEAIALRIAALLEGLAVADDATELMGGRGAVDPETIRDVEFLRALRHAGGAPDVLRMLLSLSAGRGLLQFLVNAEKSSKKFSTAFDANARKALRRARGKLTRPKPPIEPPELKPSAETLRDILGLLSERAFLVFDYYQNDVVWHSYELARLSHIATEAFLLWASLWHAEKIHSPESTAPAFLQHRAHRAWYRAAATSREIVMSDLDEQVRRIVEAVSKDDSRGSALETETAG